MEQPEIFELVKLHQIYSHSRTCWKINRTSADFRVVDFFTDRAIISKPVNSDMLQDKRGEIMSWRRNILVKMK